MEVIYYFETFDSFRTTQCHSPEGPENGYDRGMINLNSEHESGLSEVQLKHS
jgi:hypothetical protein